MAQKRCCASLLRWCLLWSVTWKWLVSLALAAGACSAQEYELGGSIGYGWYHDGTIFGAGATAQAGIRNRFAAGFVFGEDLYEHISGEVRYLYQDGHPFLASGGTKEDIQGQSHAFSYEMLFHAARRERRFRPFLELGAGAKGYVIAGPPPMPQLLASLGTLTNQDQWMFLVTAGGGVKYRLAKHVLARADFIDYMTAFPKRQIAPSGNNTARGIFQQFTPLFGLSYTF